MSQTLYFKNVLTPEGLKQNQGIKINAEGRITQISDAVPAICKKGYAIPGMPNAHSHSFQRALTGFGEKTQLKPFTHLQKLLFWPRYYFTLKPQ